MDKVIEFWEASVWVEGSKHDRETERFATEAAANAWIKEIRARIIESRREESSDFDEDRVGTDIWHERFAIRS